MILIAIKTQEYASRNIRAGQRFEVDERDVPILIAIKFARRPDSPHDGAPPGTFDMPDGERGEPGIPAEYDVKQLEAVPLSAEKPVRKKRRYNRRDMNPRN